MKNKYIYTLILLVNFTLFSCDDFLDEVPDNRTEIDSAEKIGELLAGAYPESSYFMIAESMSDNFVDIGPANTDDIHVNEWMYKWDDTESESRDTPTHYWKACYKAIAQANHALEAIEKLGDGAELSAYKGEALVARAYAHFMLVTLWGKPYNPNTSSTDLGVPYVLEPETVVLKEYKRNTVQEVYDYIEKDLIEGLSLITNDYTEPKFHFTKEAAYTFASRFYLFKGEWDKVVTYTSKVLGANPADNLRDWSTYQDLSLEEKRIKYQSSSEPTNLLIVSASSYYARQYKSGRYGLSSDQRSAIFRLDEPLGKDWIYSLFVSSSTRYYVPKFDEYFKTSNLSAGIGYAYAMNVLFTQDEALLNRIEANIMLGNTEAVTTDANTYLSKKVKEYEASKDVLTYEQLETYYQDFVEEGKYSPFYEISADKLPMLEFVLRCKQREFFHEGIRWLDNKRLGMKIVHPDFEGNEAVLSKDDPRRELQIPIIAQNLGIKANPR